MTGIIKKLNEENKRWTAKVEYQVSPDESSARIFFIDELYELHSIIENGASFENINNISIVYNGGKKSIIESNEE